MITKKEYQDWKTNTFLKSDIEQLNQKLDRIFEEESNVCHCGELIKNHTELSGHDAVEMEDSEEMKYEKTTQMMRETIGKSLNERNLRIKNDIKFLDNIL